MLEVHRGKTPLDRAHGRGECTSCLGAGVIHQLRVDLEHNPPTRPCRVCDGTGRATP